MKFTLDNKANFNTRPIPPGVVKLRKFLDNLPDGSMLTARSLSQAGIISVSHLLHEGYLLEEYKYRNISRNTNYYGNKKTIQEFRRMNG